MRITVIVTEEEHASIKKAAGLVPLSSYLKNLALVTNGVQSREVGRQIEKARAAGVSDRTLREAEEELERQQISTPGVEVEQRSVARRTGTIRKIEDVTHAVTRKHIPERTEPPRDQGAVDTAGASAPYDSGKKSGRCTYQPMGDKKCPACGKVHSRV